MINGALNLWESDNLFKSKMAQISGRTLVDVIRCFMLYQLSLQTCSIPGDVAEIGVYKGGTAKLLSLIFSSTKKKVFIFDTFNGMPPTKSGIDLHKEGDFNDASADDVFAFLSDCSNIVCYPGFFPDSATQIRDCQFSFVHVDVDIYQSVKDCCSFFYPRMIRGGIIVFDDYGFPTCPGARKAVDEFFKDKIEFPCYLLTGQSMVIKL